MSDEREPPLLILTCMRSYSSLLCGMLGQHPEMYGLPELNLFVAERLGDLVDLAQAFRPASLHGMLRTVAQVQSGAQTWHSIEQAKQWVERHRDWSTRRVMNYFQDAVAPRVCIEKSPSTVLRPDHLRRMLRMFPEAQFLHLTRHPRATCRSIHQIMQGNASRGAIGRTADSDVEGLWRRAHQNVLALIPRLAPGQYMRLQGEAFLGDVDTYLPQLADWLHVRGDAAALAATRHPERSPYACIGPPNAPFGNDPNYLRHPHFEPRPIAPQRLEGALDWVPGNRDGFTSETIRVAHRLGYR